MPKTATAKYDSISNKYFGRLKPSKGTHQKKNEPNYEGIFDTMNVSHVDKSFSKMDLKSLIRHKRSMMTSANSNYRRATLDKNMTISSIHDNETSSNLSEFKQNFQKI